MNKTTRSYTKLSYSPQASNKLVTIGKCPTVEADTSSNSLNPERFYNSTAICIYIKYEKETVRSFSEITASPSAMRSCGNAIRNHVL